MASPSEDEERDLIVRYVLGELAGAERLAFERRIAAEPELASEVGGLERTLGLLPYESAIEPPPDLRAKVLAAAAARPAPAARARARSWRWSPTLAAAAALVAVVFGVDAYRTRRELALQTEVASLLQQPNVVLAFALDGTGAASRAFGRVALDLDAKRGAVVLRGLPPLATGEVYRLWAKVGDKHVPCGNLAAREDGTVDKQLVIPVDAYDAPIDKLILTREASATAPQPQGPTVMASS